VIPDSIVNAIMIGEASLLLISLLLFFTHGGWFHFHRRSEERRIAAGRERLARLLIASTVEPDDVEALRALPRRVQIAVFLEIAMSMSGTGKERLRFLADEIGLLGRAKAFCQSRRWGRRLRGARILARLDISDPVVERLLRDPHPAVRAQAAEWGAAQPSLPVVLELLNMLADPATLARFAVQNALFRIGPMVVDPLARYLASHDGDPADAGLKVAEALAGPRFLVSGIRFSTSSDPVLRESAAALLGAIGDASGASRLVQMLSDSSSDVRAAAARGLGRMRYWQAATNLAAGLRDSSWRVRRESGMALRAVGAPGVLLLRRSLKGDDAFAADMAQLVLDLPATAG
jgi:hypothetical protein